MKKFGICLLALTLAVLLAAPAMAASITPYASMRLGIYWHNTDYNDDPGGFNPSWTDDDDDGGYFEQIATISRFGAKGQVGDIFGHAELGIMADTTDTEFTSTGNRVYTRLLYGTWKFGSGSLTIGQDYTPVTWTSSQQGPGVFDDDNSQSYDLQNAFIGVGCLWDSRRPQVRVNLDNGLYLAVIQTEDHNEPAQLAPTSGVPLDRDIDVEIPKIALGWDYKAEGIHLRPGVAFNTFNVEQPAARGTFDDDITSWLVHLHGKANVGSTTLKGTVHYGENLWNYGISGRMNPWDPGINAASAYIDATGDVEDAECWGGFIEAAIPIDPYTLTLGWGYSSSEVDVPGGLMDNADELMGYFVNVKIPITDNFSMTPEFDYWDGMENSLGEDDPDHWFVGVTWQMDF
jgi:hypothetical protein